MGGTLQWIAQGRMFCFGEKSDPLYYFKLSVLLMQFAMHNYG